MRKNPKTLPRLAAAVTVLMLLNLFTFALTADALLQVSDTTPAAVLEIDPVSLEQALPEASGSFEISATEAAAQASGNGMDIPGSPHKKPYMEIQDAETVWTKHTEIQVFHARYDNASGEITVDSGNGDKLIAPGTENRYYFDILNLGSTGAKYWIEAESGVATLTYNDQTVDIPITIRFFDANGDYLVGSEDWEPLRALNGVKDKGSLSAGHYMRYTLDWQWPFEGDDTLDTLLGDLAAEDAELTVRVAFNVRGEANAASTGGVPKTGDTSKLALWMGLFVCSSFATVILLFGHRKEEADGRS